MCPIGTKIVFVVQKMGLQTSPESMILYGMVTLVLLKKTM